MKMVIVYDSRYGNTEQMARAMAERLGKNGPVRLVAAGAAGERDLVGSDLLVVGGPTRIRGIKGAGRAACRSHAGTHADRCRSRQGGRACRGARERCDTPDGGGPV
jgi:hypothetical protein